MLSHTAVWDKWEIEKISFLISLAYRSASTHFEPLVDEPVEEDQDLEDSTLTQGLSEGK